MQGWGKAPPAPREPGTAGPCRGSSHSCSLHQECAPGLPGACYAHCLPQHHEHTCPTSPCQHPAPRGEGLQRVGGGGGEWLEKQKGNEVLHFFCYGFEGNLGPTSRFLELTVLKSSICLVKRALKYSGHSKNVNSVTGKKAHRKHVYQHQKHLQSQVTSSFNPRYIILVVSSLS